MKVSTEFLVAVSLFVACATVAIAPPLLTERPKQAAARANKEAVVIEKTAEYEGNCVRVRCQGLSDGRRFSVWMEDVDGINPGKRVSITTNLLFGARGELVSQ